MERSYGWRLLQARRATAETELLEKIARGSEAALARLYDRYSGLLFSLILAILKDSRDAEEVLQEVFLQVWRRADRYDPSRGSAYKWLVTLARTRSIDRTRSKNFARHREARSGDEALDRTADTSRASQLDAVLILERAEVVRGILAKLPPEQQRVLRLGYFLGHTQTEIARTLELPLGTVKSRMRLGLIAMRGLLNKELQP